jgi:type III secretory pathway component EscT
MLFTSPFYELVYCPDNFQRWSTMTALNVALGGVTAVVNMLLELYSRWAVKEEVHTGRTRSEASTAQTQFSAQFLNTVTVGVRL